MRSWTQTPIIVISSRSLENEKAAALDDGADDYITKPFGTVELLARIRTALRHTRTTAEDEEIGLTGSYHVDGLEVDFKKMQVLINGATRETMICVSTAVSSAQTAWRT